MGWILLALLVVLTVVAPQTPAAAREIVRPGCMDKCGNISIPYPFGVGPGCSKKGFDVACDDTVHPPRLLVDDMEVADIFVSSGQLRARAPIGRDCYDRSGANTSTSTQ